jgi:hypothetical protein
MKRFSVLLAEDYVLLNDLFTRDMEKADISVFSAKTLSETKRLYDENKDELDAIIMDACLEGDTPDTLLIVEHMIASGFKNPIIATSCDIHFSEMLMQSGATHISEKYQAVELLLELLDIHI